MGVAGATNVTLRSPRPNAIVEQWSLPAYCIAMKSPSILMAIGEYQVVIQPRVAKALNIQDFDKVEFCFDDTGERFHLQVKIMDNLDSDVLIHDLIGLQMAESVSMTRYGHIVTFNSGRIVVLPSQNMWAGIKMVKRQGSACLFFDGASRNNPRGPAGYGFHIAEGNEGKGDELIEGYGYAGMDRSNNEMEYEGLIEALVWANRLDLTKLTICGDSELIIKQLTGKYTIKNHRLKALHAKVHEFLKQNSDLKVDFRHVKREHNEIANNLAGRSIVTKKSKISVNWSNVNNCMYD